MGTPAIGTVATTGSRPGKRDNPAVPDSAATANEARAILRPPQRS